MQVFNTFFKITKKQLPSFITYFIIFTVLLSIMSSIGTGNNAYQDTRMDVAIFNNDGSKKGEYLEKYLTEKHNIVEVENDDEVIQDRLYFQVLDYVLYIEDGFKLTNIKRPGTTTGAYVDSQIDTFVKTFDSYVIAGYSEDEAYEKTIAAVDNKDLVSMKGKGNTKPTIYYFFTYLSYIFLGLLINVLAPVIIALNKKGVKERTDISPLSSKSRSAQLIGASVILSLVIWLGFMLVSVVMFKGEVFKDINAFLILNALCYLILSAAIVTLISNFQLKAQAISMVSNVLSLAFSFLGGVFVPMEIFGDTMLKIAKFIPTYWYVSAADSIMEGVMNKDIFMCMGIQLLYALAFFAISLVISKRMRVSRAS